MDIGTPSSTRRASRRCVPWIRAGSGRPAARPGRTTCATGRRPATAGGLDPGGEIEWRSSRIRGSRVGGSPSRAPRSRLPALLHHGSNDGVPAGHARGHPEASQQVREHRRPGVLGVDHQRGRPTRPGTGSRLRVEPEPASPPLRPASAAGCRRGCRRGQPPPDRRAPSEPERGLESGGSWRGSRPPRTRARCAAPGRPHGHAHQRDGSRFGVGPQVRGADQDRRIQVGTSASTRRMSVTARSGASDTEAGDLRAADPGPVGHVDLGERPAGLGSPQHHLQRVAGPAVAQAESEQRLPVYRHASAQTSCSSDAGPAGVQQVPPSAPRWPTRSVGPTRRPATPSGRRLPSTRSAVPCKHRVRRPGAVRSDRGRRRRRRRPGSARSRPPPRRRRRRRTLVSVRAPPEHRERGQSLRQLRRPDEPLSISTIAFRIRRRQPGQHRGSAPRPHRKTGQD